MIEESIVSSRASKRYIWFWADPFGAGASLPISGGISRKHMYVHAGTVATG
jgi:hypothetical protein